MVNTPPVYILVSACTKKSASAYQSVMVISFIFNARFSSRVSWGYLIILNKFLLSSSSGTLNLVQGWILSLTLLHRNNYLAIIVWNTSAFSASRFFALGFTVNKYSAAGFFTISRSSLLPCKEMLQIFYQYILSYKYSFLLMLYNPESCLDNNISLLLMAWVLLCLHMYPWPIEWKRKQHPNPHETL